MSAPDRFIAWCKQEQASLQQQLELLEASEVLTGEDRGSGGDGLETAQRNNLSGHNEQTGYND